MWIRSAFWIGRPKAGFEEQFVTEVNDVLRPALRACPGIRDVLILWPHEREDNPPEIACQLLLMFERAEDITTMLVSPERDAVRLKVPAIIALFDGAVSHVNFEAISDNRFAD